MSTKSRGLAVCQFAAQDIMLHCRLLCPCRAGARRNITTRSSTMRSGAYRSDVRSSCQCRLSPPALCCSHVHRPYICGSRRDDDWDSAFGEARLAPSESPLMDIVNTGARLSSEGSGSTVAVFSGFMADHPALNGAAGRDNIRYIGFR